MTSIRIESVSAARPLLDETATRDLSAAALVAARHVSREFGHRSMRRSPGAAAAAIERGAVCGLTSDMICGIRGMVLLFQLTLLPKYPELVLILKRETPSPCRRVAPRFAQTFTCVEKQKSGRNVTSVLISSEMLIPIAS
jgi:hypothetical protein